VGLYPTQLNLFLNLKKVFSWWLGGGGYDNKIFWGLTIPPQFPSMDSGGLFKKI